ncbi:hypothetical protein [Paenibacillus sp. S150]|uniref:hypothetical protein n=1 Tax=Paenibacillus sp. S150 TaxID=2749826 RepID=UPI001C56179E|nr:hypothetical protein [Paenibacillus sp. S150]MBW4081239.1 hypothetical protein [Paenibacillus sp. S150]
MIDCKTIWLCAQLNFKKWKITPRIYTLAVVVGAFSLWMFSWIADYSAAVDTDVSPWVFPYLMSVPVMFHIFGCLTALLFCDAPFTDNHTPFLMIRMSKRDWAIGQLLYIVLAAFVYTAFFTLMSMLVLIPNVKFSSDWGTVLKTIAFNRGSLNKYNITPYAEIGSPVITMFSALPAMLISFGLFWLVSVFIGVLIFSFQVVIGRLSGLIAAGIFTFISYFSVYAGQMAYGRVIYYVSPLNWSSMFYLDWGGAGQMPSPAYAVSVLAVSILLMSTLSIIVFCRRDMNIQRG